MKKKGLAMVLALVLLAVCAVSGTLAWLTAKSDTVVNTFTTSDITVKLKETTGDEYQMIPGYTRDKDPKAWVEAGSVDCFLFVKLDWANNTYTASDGTTKNYITWAPADGWTLVDGQSNVYFRIVKANEMSKDDGETNSYPVLANNKVTVSGDITKEMMNAFMAENLPKLTITAYASQLYKTNGVEFTAAEAWANVGVTP